MASLRLTGGNPLYGEITVQGSKNAALPMMAAALLCKEEVILRHVPDIEDVRVMLEILKNLGCGVVRKEDELILCARQLCSDTVPEALSGKMRSSVLLLGALLGRSGQARLSYPGGCAIGSRPIDFHLQGLAQMNAAIQKTDDGILAQAVSLKGAEIRLPFPSVGATENLILAAVLADGITIIRNCAREPEIAALCRLLVRMGAQILGIGTEKLIIAGVKELHGARMRVEGDRIVAGTWLLCAAACGGMIEIADFCPEQLGALYPVLRKSGCTLLPWRERMMIQSDGQLRGAGALRTEPYPGFPTDLQSLILAAFSMAQGQTSVEETIFENRFLAVPELNRMGANIRVEGRKAVVSGGCRLVGTKVTASDLRGGAALVLAGLAAQGETCIRGCEHILRGYEDLPGKLSGLGVTFGGMNEEEQA